MYQDCSRHQRWNSQYNKVPGFMEIIFWRKKSINKYIVYTYIIMFPDIMHIMKKNKASGMEILKVDKGTVLHRVVRADFEALAFKGRLQWKDRVKHEKVWNLEEESEGKTGTSLVVQWLKLQTPNAGGPGLIPGHGTRFHMPHTTKDTPCCNKDLTQPIISLSVCLSI